MTDYQRCSQVCRYCGTEIMKVGQIWYKLRVADINGICPLP